MTTLTAPPIPHLARSRQALEPLHVAPVSTAAAAPTPEAILQLGLAFWGSKTLLSAVELDVFTQLAREPGTVEEVQSRLGLHARSARDFLDALVALGFLQRIGKIYS